jgi:peptide chain release factor 1
MFDKLENVERRFDELTDKLASGTLAPVEMTRVAKEQAALRELVETFRAARQARRELTDNKGLIQTESDEAMRVLVKEEIVRLETKITDLEQRLKILLLPRDPHDEKNVVLEIRAGTGGEEAALFAGDLFRMYTRYAESLGWRVELISENPTGRGGFKEVIALISGEHVYSRLKFEGGIHRVQRIPDTEASGRIHTSAVSVVVMPEAEDIELNIPAADLRVDVFRAGGHGGQSVNTTDSAVRMVHLPTGIVVVCQDEKSQQKNKAKALKVLRARVLDKLEGERAEKEARQRKSLVGTGDRSEKIRTYNFPQSRVTDHRIGLTLHELDQILAGRLTPLVEALTAHHQAELLQGAAGSG